MSSWRVEPFVMVYDGPRWIPPPLPETRARGSRRRHGRSRPNARLKLSAADRDALVEILRHVTVTRDDVRDAMEFAIERAECAADVVDVVTASCSTSTRPRLPLAPPLRRLRLLHNCSAPVRGVQAYRGQFIRTLPQIFEHLERYVAAMAVGVVSRRVRARRPRRARRVGRLVSLRRRFRSRFKTFLPRRRHLPGRPSPSSS